MARNFRLSFQELKLFQIGQQPHVVQLSLVIFLAHQNSLLETADLVKFYFEPDFLISELRFAGIKQYMLPDHLAHGVLILHLMLINQLFDSALQSFLLFLGF